VKLVRMTDGYDWRLWIITGLIFALTAITGSEPILVIIGAGLLMILLDARPSLRRRPRDIPPSDGDEQPEPQPAIP
jgi:chromate transporter